MNTAASVAIGALYAKEKYADPIILVAPCDHYIAGDVAFKQTMATAVELAENNIIAVFGVTPSYPSTYYGYIEAGLALQNTNAFSVFKFHEKPNFDTAVTYISDKKFYWNSGIFMFKADTVMTEYEKYAGDILFRCQNIVNQMDTNATNHLVHFEFIQNISFDYAIMEKTHKAVMVPFTAQWSDIGNCVIC